MDITKKLAAEFKISENRVLAAVELIDGGNTVPFIARYRKEATGGLDDVALRELFDRLGYLRGLEKRRDEIRDAIDGQGKLSAELEKALGAAESLTELEDIYRPYKPKRRTRASVAREKGLEELALALLLQEKDAAPEREAQRFIDPEKGVADFSEALDGACDIIAEDISDNAEFRREIRRLTWDYGFIKTKKVEDKEKSGEKDEKANAVGSAPGPYELYHDFSGKITELPGHRILAINRAEKEGAIRVSLDIEPEVPLNYLFPRVVSAQDSPARPYVARAVTDSYTRLIAPSVEREIMSELFERASEGAIKVFSDNLKKLLMQAPVKGMTVLGFDPGYRTGCKLAVVDRTGRVLGTGVIYPTIKSEAKTAEAKTVIKKLIRAHGVDIIAVGNGTASRESEQFVAEVLREIPENVKYAIVSEAGASVYSASKLGAEEFPEYDVTLRSAVSIARRLQDPLAELIKIDPKSIGVGQYQHDMKPARLDEALSGVVEDAVNAVGVDVNTASYPLLSHVAGIGEATAKNIVKYREEKGEFTARSAIKKVPRVGERAYEQSAGFLRVPGSAEILDNTGVHPESYEAARGLLALLGYKSGDINARGGSGKLSELSKAAEKYGVSRLCEALSVGEPTLRDIIAELEKPGRDVRDGLPQPQMRTDVMDIADLRPGMALTGTVRNVTDFGAFVDIGVHQDGLVHVSQICERYIKHPSEVLSVGDIVNVRVISVDAQRNKISLTMKG